MTKPTAQEMIDAETRREDIADQRIELVDDTLSKKNLRKFFGKDTLAELTPGHIHILVADALHRGYLLGYSIAEEDIYGIDNIG